MTVLIWSDPPRWPKAEAAATLARPDYPWMAEDIWGQPGVWPCGLIGYRLVVEGAPADAELLAVRATGIIRAAAGYEFREDPPLQLLSQREAEYVGITIAWVPRAEVRSPNVTVIGIGSAELKKGIYHSGYADVVREWPGSMRADFSKRGAGAVLLHELGHALGLSHDDDPNGVMYPVNHGVTRWSEREVAALRYLRQQCV